MIKEAQVLEALKGVNGWLGTALSVLTRIKLCQLGERTILTHCL